jgi:hypothetical protein
MAYEKKIKKIKSFSWMLLLLMIVELVGGVALIYVGNNVNSLDIKERDRMLEYIRKNNTTFYEKITSSQDSTYIRNFNEHFIKEENKAIIKIGYILIIIAIHNIYFNMKIFTLSHEKDQMQRHDTKRKIIQIPSFLNFIKRGKKDETEEIMPDNKEE